MTRHADFEYILGEFKRYYKDDAKAMTEYTAWLNALKLNDSKSYGQSRESFQWAKDMITRFKEDAANVYYRVLVGFPTRSMNRNVYKERDLVAAAHTLVGKHPSINHKDEYHLSPDNPHNRWGVVTVVAAAPEDGAVEAILQVPKTAKCPVCNGALLTELIDKKRIYNVSLEGECASGGGGQCDGFQFTEHGFSLLTTDVLPGIPMTKIYPIESFLGFLPPLETKRSKHPAIRIVGLSEGELSGLANPQDGTVKVVTPDGKGQCPAGMFYSMRVGGCIPIGDNTATDGFGQLEKGANTAASNLRKPRDGIPGRVQMKPEGTDVTMDGSNSVDRWHSGNQLKALSDNDPNRSMGYPGALEDQEKGANITDNSITHVGPNASDQLPGGPIPNRSPSDQPAYGADDTKARMVKTEWLIPEDKDKREGWGDSTFPDSSFMYVPDSAKGADGNKSDRKLPVKTKDGKWHMPHVRNALARLNQAVIPDAAKTKIQTTLQNVLKKDNPDYEPECVMTGPMAALAGQTRVLSDQGDSDKHHPDNDSDWLIETAYNEKGVPAGGVGTSKAGPAMNRIGKDGGSPLDTIPQPGVDQPATTRGPDGCVNGMHWSVPDGMCVMDDPENEKGRQVRVRQNPTAREGPNMLDEPDPANAQMGKPPVPPIDQPTSGGLVRHQCPEGYTYDADTGMCEYDAAQTETIKHGDVRGLVDKINKTKTLNTTTPGPYTKRDQPSDASQAGQCRDGMVFDKGTGMCVPLSDMNEDSASSGGARDIECPDGFDKDPKTGMCTPSLSDEASNMKTDITGTHAKQLIGVVNDPASECPDGYVWNGKLGMCEPTDNAPTGSHPHKDNPAYSGECKTDGTSFGDLAGQTRVLSDQGDSDRHHPDNDSQWLIERIREAQARANVNREYTFDQCMSDHMKKGMDIADAKKVCNNVHYPGKEHAVSHELQLSQALSDLAALEARFTELMVQRKSELTAAGNTITELKALVAKHWNALQMEKDHRLQLEGRLNQMQTTLDAHDDKTRLAHNERVELETRLSRRERDLTEALENVSKYKQGLEDTRAQLQQTDEKYRGALVTNLALNKAITKSNEDYLRLAKDKEAVEEQLKKAQRLAKHIVVNTRM